MDLGDIVTNPWAVVGVGLTAGITCVKFLAAQLRKYQALVIDQANKSNDRCEQDRKQLIGRMSGLEERQYKDTANLVNKTTDALTCSARALEILAENDRRRMEYETKRHASQALIKKPRTERRDG
jgi:hypothetical protein